MKHKVQGAQASTSRRSFLRKGLAVGGAGVIGALANRFPAVAKAARGGLTKTIESLERVEQKRVDHPNYPHGMGWGSEATKLLSNPSLGAVWKDLS